jgi:hypothetical protein
LTDSFYTEAAWNISYEFGNAEFDDKSLGLSTRLVRASTGGANGLLQIAASLNASITSPITGQETKLTPSLAFAGNVPAGATLTQVRWDFGDGSPGVMISDAANFTVPQYKSYAAADSYLVTLRLTANTGQNWEITRTIVVESYAPTGLLANANTVANIGDYTRLGADGQSLAIQNAAWNDNGSNAAGTRWECIKDNQSGLIWEVKTKNDPSALRDYRSTFIWYDVSEGSSGVQIDGDRATCNGVADLAKCNTQSYTTAVKGLPTGQALCGFRDWRMPSLNELLSLVLTPSREIYINETHFPDIDFSLKQDSGLMWTATQIGSNPDQAGAINFKSGITGNAPKNYGLSIRSGSTNLNSWDK